MWSQAQWVQMNILSIQEMGIEQWLKQWLDILEGDIVINEDITRDPPLSPGTRPRRGEQGKLRRK